MQIKNTKKLQIKLLVHWDKKRDKRGRAKIMNEKQFLTLDHQILKLEKKNVHVPNTQRTLQLLRDSNYINLVSCSKVKFASGRFTSGQYEYNPSHFKDWVKYYQQDCSLSKHLMVNLLDFEKTINSRTAYYVSELLEAGTLTIIEMASLKETIKGHQNRSKYEGERTWEHVAQKTFGELRYIIKWLWENRQNFILEKIFLGYDFFGKYLMRKLDEIVNLRNNIFHFRPLNIYLIYGNKKNNRSNYKLRKEIVEDIFNLNPNKRSKVDMVEIMMATRRFNGIKKRPNSISRKTL